MDYSKIKLNNERNQHVNKRLNRLNTWNFFKVLYRDNIMRLFGFSLLMILFMAPIVVIMMLGDYNNSMIAITLPQFNGMGFSTGVWNGMQDYYAQKVATNNLYVGLLCVAVSLPCALILSGGFAVIRDAFWTGKLSTVGVFKSFGKGVKSSIVYALVADLILAFSIFGAYRFYVWAITIMPLWLSIILLVLLCIVIMFVAIYLFILCSVATVYKQSVADNLDDAWRLMWLNILPNIIHFLLALIPIALYFATSGTAFFTIILVILLMFGGMYVPLVWQTHMMKTFALFHPVEVKKKKKNQQVRAVADGNAAAQTENKEPPVSTADENFEDEDVYSTDDDEQEVSDTAVIDEQADVPDDVQADNPDVNAEEPDVNPDADSDDNPDSDPDKK